MREQGEVGGDRDSIRVGEVGILRKDRALVRSDKVKGGDARIPAFSNVDLPICRRSVDTSGGNVRGTKDGKRKSRSRWGRSRTT